MALSTDLMGTGISYNSADKLGYNPQTLAAAGTTQGTAAVAVSKCIEMTATGSDGIILGNVDIGTPCWVFNSSASTGLVYVPSGHTLNTTLNGSLSLATHKGGCLVQYKNKFWMSLLTA